MRYLCLFVISLLFFGCAQLPNKRECFNTLKSLPHKQDSNISRVYVFSPKRDFSEAFSLLGGGIDVELTSIGIDSMDIFIGRIGHSTLAYFNVSTGKHSLYAENPDLKDNPEATESSKIDFSVKPGEDAYFIVKNRNNVSTAIFGRYYPRYYEQIDLKTMSDLIKANCEDRSLLKTRHFIAQ